MTQFTIGTFVVIFDRKGRVLLSHRRDLDIWNLPGGSVERGELPPEAAIRETMEETGLKIKVTRFVGLYGKPHRNEFVFVFTAKVISGKLEESTEADRNQYFKIKNIPENTIPKHVERIHDAAKMFSKPVFSWQNSLSGRDWLKKISRKRKPKKQKPITDHDPKTKNPTG